jgi:hypothetical protein
MNVEQSIRTCDPPALAENKIWTEQPLMGVFFLSPRADSGL